MSVIPCYRGGHNCNWPACAQDCDGRPGADACIRDALREVRDAHAAARAEGFAEGAPSWQPVETAPLDDTSVIVCSDGGVVGEAWHFEGGWYWANCYPTDATDGSIDFGIRCWMPLPTIGEKKS